MSFDQVVNFRFLLMIEMVLGEMFVDSGKLYRKIKIGEWDEGLYRNDGKLKVVVTFD